MRAVICTSPDPRMEGLALSRSPVPEPGSGQVRVAMRAASLNPVDWKLASGVAPWWEAVGPRIVGLDGAGTIDALGDSVFDWKIGDRVVWHGDLNRDGVLADFALADAHVLSRIPDNVEFEQAAALPCAGYTAFQALVRKARIRPDEVVLIQGASGAVGGFGVQIAHYLGAEVIALARLTSHSRVRALGANHVFDRNVPDLRERINKLTGGDGVDIMLEVANPGDARLSLDLIRYNGQLLCVDPLPDLSHVSAYTYAASIHEVALGGAYAAGHRPTQEDFAVMGDAMLELLRQGRLDPLIERIIPLDDAVEGLKELREKGASGKVVVSISKGQE